MKIWIPVLRFLRVLVGRCPDCGRVPNDIRMIEPDVFPRYEWWCASCRKQVF